MKFGIRELIFVGVMVGLLVSTYVFVFQKSNARREQKLAEIRNMDTELSSLRQATAGAVLQVHLERARVQRLPARAPVGVEVLGEVVLVHAELARLPTDHQRLDLDLRPVVDNWIEIQHLLIDGPHHRQPRPIATQRGCVQNPDILLVLRLPRAG